MPSSSVNQERVLVFVEVRTRLRKASRARQPSALRATSWLRPEWSVGPEKQRRIRTVASLYLLRYAGAARSIRFDVLGWSVFNGQWERVWIPEAF